MPSTIIDKRSFSTSKSTTQYDLYKYKLQTKVIYRKKKNYRYKVKDTIYNLMLSENNTYRYLLSSRLSKPAWEIFKQTWEVNLIKFGLLNKIIEHILGIIKLNNFYSISFPEELEDMEEFSESILLDSNSRISLKIYWFEEDVPNIKDLTISESKELILVIFNNKY